MAIYDADGNQLYECYDADGNSLNYAYDADGNVIYSKSYPPVVPSMDYSNYSFIQKWTKSIANAQGFGIHNNSVYWASKRGNDTIPTNCYVINLSDGTWVLNQEYVTIYGGHCNNIDFNGDDVYVSTAYNPATVYINKLNDDYTFTLDKTLYFANVYDIDACIDKSNPTILWGLSHNFVETELFITKWDLTNLTDNGDGTYTPRLMHSTATVRPVGNFMQGTRIHDSMLWYACGNGGQRAYVYAVNPYNGDVMYTIDLETNQEPEGIEWIGNTLYVGLQGMIMREYTFTE